MSNGNASEVEIKKETGEKCIQRSRFKGITMNISLKGQDTVQNEINKRITSENIDRIANLLSSNPCENYFGCLVKYSEGKRLTQIIMICGKYTSHLLRD